MSYWPNQGIGRSSVKQIRHFTRETTSMKSPCSSLNARIGLFTAVLFAFSDFAESADTPTLKDAYKGDFYVGVAINRTIAMSAAVRADNVNRNIDQVNQDVALAKEHFDQISPENDLKWALIQPQEGPDGYNFGPADAYVNFGLSNHM